MKDWLIEGEHAVILGLIGWLLRQVYLLRSEISYLSGASDNPNESKHNNEGESHEGTQNP